MNAPKANNPFRLIFWLVFCLPEVSLAHAGERGFIMLLPTTFFITAGTLAVLSSLIIVSSLPNSIGNFFLSSSKTIFHSKKPHKQPFLSIATLLLISLLIVAGFTGNSDPLKNPIGPIIWSWFWIGFVMLQVLFGNLWSIVNPWLAMAAIGARLRQILSINKRTLPSYVNYWPAVLLLLSFLWFENISLAPYDPIVLSNVVLTYLLFTFCGITIFGYRQWCKYVEIFSIYFRFASTLSAFKWNDDKRITKIQLVFPGASLLHHNALPISGVIFVLVTVAGITFDGGLRSFSWLGFIGVNPLEFAGRSQVLLANTFGLIGACLCLSAIFYLTIYIGSWLTKLPFKHSGKLALAMIPIAFGYHVAHYLPSFLLEAQYGLYALNDPFNLQWDLIGLSGSTIYASVQTDYHIITKVWYLQIIAISTCHIVAVYICHAIAAKYINNRKSLFIYQLPYSILMLGYTTLGLWLLSTPGI